MSTINRVAGSADSSRDAGAIDKTGAPRQMTMHEALQARLEWERFLDRMQVRGAVGARA